MAEENFYNFTAEPSKRTRKVYHAWSWRVQIDHHPEGKWWDWMIDEQDNRGTRWHRSDAEPTYEEIRSWLAAQEWTGEETRA